MSTSSFDHSLHERPSMQIEDISDRDAEVEAPAETSVTLPMLAVATTVSLFMGILLLASYHSFFAQPQMKFGKVNLGEIVEIKQSQFSLAMMGADVANKSAAREMALKQVEDTGKQIEQSLNTLSSDCKCTLLVTGAVLSSTLPDYTEQLKERLGLKGTDVAVLRKLVAASILADRPQANAQGAMK